MTGIFPVALATIIGFIVAHSTEMKQKDLLGKLFFNIVSSIPWVLFAVPWHRWIILNEVPRLLKTITWSYRHTIFLMFGFIACLPSTLLVHMGRRSAIGGMLSVIVYPAVIYLSTRLSLLLPATAIDIGYSFTYAWDLSKDRTGKLIIILGSAFIVSSIIVIPIYYFCRKLNDFSVPIELIGHVLTSIGVLGGEAICVSALSFAYQSIKEEDIK